MSRPAIAIGFVFCLQSFVWTKYNTTVHRSFPHSIFLKILGAVLWSCFHLWGGLMLGVVFHYKVANMWKRWKLEPDVNLKRLLKRYLSGKLYKNCDWIFHKWYESKYNLFLSGKRCKNESVLAHVDFQPIFTSNHVWSESPNYTGRRQLAYLCIWCSVLHGPPISYLPFIPLAGVPRDDGHRVMTQMSRQTPYAASPTKNRSISPTLKFRRAHMHGRVSRCQSKRNRRAAGLLT